MDWALRALQPTCGPRNDLPLVIASPEGAWRSPLLRAPKGRGNLHLRGDCFGRTRGLAMTAGLQDLRLFFVREGRFVAGVRRRDAARLGFPVLGGGGTSASASARPEGNTDW